MDLYFYSNKNSLFNYLSRNLIACEAVVPELRQNRTIGTVCDHLLFLTHHKLDRLSRTAGIQLPELVNPVTLVVELTEEMLSSQQKIILVEQGESDYAFSVGQWNAYLPGRHIGAFVLAPIPFSCVSAFYFDNQDEMDSFDRPSPDYWYPRDRFGILPEGFTDVINLTIREDDVFEQTGISSEEVEVSIRTTEKRQGALLQLINLTKIWRCGKYRLNIDPVLQSVFELSDEEITTMIPNYREIKNLGNPEELELLQFTPTENQSENQILYNCVFNTFLDSPFGIRHGDEYFESIFREISTNVEKDGLSHDQIAGWLAQFMMLLQGKALKTPENMMCEIPKKWDVLQSVLFAIRDADNYDQFLSSLDVYHVDCKTARRAAVLWGALNGLKGIPGEGEHKDDRKVWQFVEWKISCQQTVSFGFNVPKPSVVNNDGRILGMVLRAEEIITVDDVYDLFFSLGDNALDKDDCKKILDSLKKSKGKKKTVKGKKSNVSKYCFYQCPAISGGIKTEEDIQEIKDILDKVLKAPEYNKKRLFEDFLSKKTDFETVFKEDELYWKKRYIQLREVSS